MTDPPVCSECGKPLDDSRPWIPDMIDGTGAHMDCLEEALPEEGEEDL